MNSRRKQQWQNDERMAKKNADIDPAATAARRSARKTSDIIDAERRRESESGFNACDLDKKRADLSTKLRSVDERMLKALSNDDMETHERLVAQHNRIQRQIENITEQLERK
jgi:hypothetical protein